MAYLGKQPALQSNEFREEFNITSTTSTIATSGFVVSGKSNYLDVYKNGVLLGSDDYTLGADRKTITLASDAIAGDIIVIIGRRNLTQGVRFSERRHEHTIANNETTVTFPYPLTGDSTDVYLNGVKLASSDFSINVSTKVISFTVNPVNGDVIAIVSREPATSSSTVLPIVDSNGGSVISESNGSVVVNAGTANIGSNALVVDSSGNVGIGTSPSYPLHVSDTLGFPILIERTNTSDAGIRFKDINTTNADSVRIGAIGDAFRVFTNGSERLRIDSSGNVGIGVNNPLGKLHVEGKLVFTVGNTRGIAQNRNGAISNILWKDNTATDNLNLFNPNGSNLIFGTNNTERMRINSNGSIIFTTRGLSIESDGNGDPRIRADSNPITILAGSSNGVKLALNAGSWTNLSDENIKTDLAPIENGIEKIKQVRTVTGRFITDDESVRRAFLIAQDFQTILPEAVVEFEQGKLGLNYTDVIPLLTAALQESIALIESQQEQINNLITEVEALKAQ